MTDSEAITVNVKVDITPASLQAIVENAKTIAGQNERGFYHVDTADKVSEMISRFLLENNFESYAKNIANYTR
ncbi:hypothetical protein QUF80_08595 [Desulfococcaceae bacterium HSG8]|nr:hypothetical protein [Desulfococcaceae bacterium HSG8]